MLRLQLDAAQRHALHERSEGEEPGWVHQRIEMLRLASNGWSPPRIAEHLECHPQTVRRLLHAFEKRGLAVLDRALPGPAPDEQRRRRIERLLEGLLKEARTWTARQLATALHDKGISLGERQVRRYLADLGATWKRTKRTLSHQQPSTTVAKKQLFMLKKSPQRAIGPVLRG